MVAELAGVHVSTASRILRTEADDNGRKDTEVVRRVREASRRLNYVPDYYAASLRTQRIRAIGVLVPRLTDVVLATIYEGIDDEASQLGYQTLVANTLDRLALRRRRAELLRNRKVDCLIISDGHRRDPFLSELAAEEYPFVLVNRHVGDHPSVTCDDFAGGRLVGNHLADLGHEDIGIVAGLRHASTGWDRTRGCIGCLEERGIEVPSANIVFNGFSVKAGRMAAERLLSNKQPPTAIFAVNDYAAIGVMGAARDFGLEIGRDIAIVGFNDIDLAAELPVPLTSVRNPMREMGILAARAMVDRLQGGQVVSVRLSPTLLVRQSTSPRSRRNPNEVTVRANQLGK